MDALLVNGDEIELTPDPPWRWMVPPVKLKLSALPGHTVKAKAQFSIWESEILSAGLLAAGQMYAAPGFDTPGSVLTVTLMVNPGTMSAAVKDMKQPVATVATTGTFMASVVPAMNPANGMPDPVVVKTGTWSVASQVQDVALSGQPAQAGADGEDGGSGVGSSDGESTAEDEVAERKPNHVAVFLEDAEGNALAAHQISIGPPDGRWVSRTLTQSGSARVDGILPEGEATVQLLSPEINPRIKTPERPWVAFTVVDEDGAPMEGVVIQVKTPDGQELKVKTGPNGAVRIPLGVDGECEVQVVSVPDALGEGDAPGEGSGPDAAGSSEAAGEGAEGSGADAASDVAADEVRIELVDAQGQPMAGETIVVRRANGEEESHTLDGDGTLLLNVDQAEELEVSFPDTLNVQVEDEAQSR